MSLFLFIYICCKYDKLSKGVSILSHQLPCALQLAWSYSIASNSKAA
jgi:hypothetical protein